MEKQRDISTLIVVERETFEVAKQKPVLKHPIMSAMPCLNPTLSNLLLKS